LKTFQKKKYFLSEKEKSAFRHGLEADFHFTLGHGKI